MEEDNPVLDGAPAEVGRDDDPFLRPVPAAVEAGNISGFLDPVNSEGDSATVAPVAAVDGAFLLLDKTEDAVESSTEKTVSLDSPASGKLVATDDAKAKATGKADAEVARLPKKPKLEDLFPPELAETEMYWNGKRRLYPDLTRSQDELPARNLANQLREKGHICVEVKGKQEGWYYECTLCNYFTVYDFEITRHLDDKDHKIMLQSFSYSMLPNARKWPFNDGVQFFNSCPQLDNDDETCTIESSQYQFKSQKIGIGRIFRRVQVTQTGRKDLCTRSIWCEWLGTENPQIPSQDGFRDYPVAILAFMVSDSFLDHCSKMPKMRLKCVICETEIKHGYFCATLVSSTTSTVLCPATNDPHIFHVSCLVNWILAIELYVLKGLDSYIIQAMPHFCPTCAVTLTGDQISGEKKHDVLKIVRQGGKLWGQNFEKLKNNSTGMSFGSSTGMSFGSEHATEDTEDTEEVVAAWKCIDFYKGCTRVEIEKPKPDQK